MNCSISSGIGVNCADLKKPGGLARYIWVGNWSDLQTAFPEGTYVSAIDLTSGSFLYKLESAKFSHEVSWRQVKDEGNHAHYVHTVNINLFNVSPENDAVIQDLAKSRLFFVALTNANEFLIYGATFGIKSVSGNGGTGRTLQQVTTTNMIFEGPDLHIPLRFFVSNFRDTVDYLDDLQNPEQSPFLAQTTEFAILTQTGDYIETQQ